MPRLRIIFTSERVNVDLDVTDSSAPGCDEIFANHSRQKGDRRHEGACLIVRGELVAKYEPNRDKLCGWPSPGRWNSFHRVEKTSQVFPPRSEIESQLPLRRPAA